MAITYDQDAPGRGAVSQMANIGSHRLKAASGTFTFDTSYPTGGEDITDIFNLFASTLFVQVQQPIQAGAQTGKFVWVDHANKKIQLFTNAAPFAEVANASDQSNIPALRWFAVGY